MIQNNQNQWENILETLPIGEEERISERENCKNILASKESKEREKFLAELGIKDGRRKNGSKKSKTHNVKAGGKNDLSHLSIDDFLAGVKKVIAKHSTRGNWRCTCGLCASIADRRESIAAYRQAKHAASVYAWYHDALAQDSTDNVRKAAFAELSKMAEKHFRKVRVINTLSDLNIRWNGFATNLMKLHTSMDAVRRNPTLIQAVVHAATLCVKASKRVEVYRNAVECAYTEHV